MTHGGGEMRRAAWRTRTAPTRDQFAAIVQASQDAVISETADGTITNWNRAASDLYGYSAEEMIGRGADILYPPHRRAREHEILARINNGERALTHQLLAFGRRETVQPQVLSLNRVVTDLEQVLRRTVGERVQVRIRLRPDAGSVLADHGQLEQVLVNLALNARDAMPDGGVLTIETERLELDAGTTAARAGLRPGPHLRLRVSDTGAGIPDDLIDRVFEPFFTTKPKGESSGLGLATVYGVISQSGGHTEITSELGTGTSVTCLLPVTDVRPVPASPPAPLAVGPARGGGTILLVEDEDPLREVTLRILTRNGYRVLTASGGAEALGLVTCPREAGDEIDLLVTDVIMPGMQGRELAGRVQAQLPAVRVVYMSGYAHPVLTTHGWLDPGVVLLEKPFTERDLLDTVRRVLSGG